MAENRVWSAARPLIAAAGAIAVLTASAGAQSCAGRPVGGLAARAMVADVAHVRYDAGGSTSGVDAGAEYWANPRGFSAYSVGYARRLMDGDDPHVAHVQVIAELPAWSALPPGAGVCITSGLAASWYRDADVDVRRRSLSLPLGVSAGFVIPAGPVARFYPYVSPRVVFTDTRGGAAPPDDRSPYAAVEAGLGFARAALVARAVAAVSLTDVGTARTPFPDLRAGLQLGVRF